VTVVGPSQDIDAFSGAVEGYAAMGVERVLLPARPEAELRKVAESIAGGFEMSG
jgi:hypothetical protein